eukprot:m.130621 g.130621  ORF g.130621 m.130621 type:complete len:114 (-) comp9791_c0_seq1:1108-1449(-)
MKARDKRKSFGLTEGALLEVRASGCVIASLLAVVVLLLTAEQGGNRVSFSKLVVQQFVDPCPAQFELVLEIWPLPGAGQIVDYIVPCALLAGLRAGIETRRLTLRLLLGCSGH